MRSLTRSPVPDRPPTGGLRVVALLAQVAAAVILGGAGAHKFTGAEADIALFTQLGMEPAGRYLIGALELAAAGALLLPLTRVYGALLGLGIMLGAVIGHLTDLGIEGLPAAGTVAVLCGAVIYFRRHEVEFIRQMWDR